MVLVIDGVVMKRKSLFRKSMVLMLVPIIILSIVLIFVSKTVIQEYFREDSYKNLWVGTWGGGLNKISFSKNDNSSVIKKIDYYKHTFENTESITSNIVQAIFEDSKKNIWIGTEEGLDLYNSKSDGFFHFKNELNNENSLSDNRIQSKCIIEDPTAYIQSSEKPHMPPVLEFGKPILGAGMKSQSL